MLFVPSFPPFFTALTFALMVQKKSMVGKIAGISACMRETVAPNRTCHRIHEHHKLAIKKIPVTYRDILNKAEKLLALLNLDPRGHIFLVFCGTKWK